MDRYNFECSLAFQKDDRISKLRRCHNAQFPSISHLHCLLPHISLEFRPQKVAESTHCERVIVHLVVLSETKILRMHVSYDIRKRRLERRILF